MIYKMRLFIGIDDSGRGPIIGPMVLAGVAATSKQIQLMKKQGVKDSKKLSKMMRKNLYKIIKENSIAYHIIKIPAIEIDSRASAGLNLNDIEAIKSASIVNNIMQNKEFVSINKEQDERPDERPTVIIDCPSTNTKAWKLYVARHIKQDVTLLVEHKADTNHVIVGAASILAKVTRDAEIENIKKQVGINFGSGYPSDPITVKFLEKYSKKFSNLGIFRKTWATWHNIKSKKSQRRLDNFLVKER